MGDAPPPSWALPAACLGTIPLSWLTHRLTSSVMLRGAVAASWMGVTLALPLHLPPRTPETMISAVFAFILPLKGLQMLISPPDNLPTKPMPSLWAWFKQFAFYAFPVSEVPADKRPSPAQIAASTVTTAIVASLKYYAAPVICQVMHSLATRDSKPVLPLIVLFTVETMRGTWSQDLQCTAVSVFSGGRYALQPFNDWVVLSTSLGELWGSRYNKLISSLLRDTVYGPCKRAGLSGQSSLLASFAMSGALHMFVARVVFHKGEGRTMCFFLLHAAAILAERSLSNRYPKAAARVPSFVKASLVMAFMWASLPLYGSLRRGDARDAQQEPLQGGLGGRCDGVDRVQALRESVCVRESLWVSE